MRRLEVRTLAADNTRFSIYSKEAPMPGGGWSCPHEINGSCGKVNKLPCDPGMKGCELFGRYVFFDDKKNAHRQQKLAHSVVRKPGESSD